MEVGTPLNHREYKALNFTANKKPQLHKTDRKLSLDQKRNMKYIQSRRGRRQSRGVLRDR